LKRSQSQNNRAHTVDSDSGKAPFGGLTPRWRILVGAFFAALIVVVGGLIYGQLTDKSHWSPAAPASSSSALADFVGSETCGGCHQPEADLWRRSQHKHAMDHASESSVIGDFNDAAFKNYGVTSRFFRKDDQFFVETDGPDGRLAIFEVKYTFGVDPLQQYLIEFPDGRIQALTIAWDSRPKGNGGQRWFSLYPNEEIPHDDYLHWTKLNQNWNFMCAECHSTGVKKNYDAEGDRFSTTWAEINVGCEACHGQGSAHLAWARKQESWWPFGKNDDPNKGLPVTFDERRNVSWSPGPATGNPHRSNSPATLRKEVETCGLCHARRGQFSEDWVPGQWLSDTHMVSPLSRGLYSADGQMLDEVYNYGSFKQSKMFAAGVTCSDCHDPHSAELRLTGEGACLQCHSPQKYASETHSHHQDISPALDCASCHMPVRTYMVVDQRHDHSFRVPRPDLSTSIGTPNACNDCHTDKTAEWASTAIENWFGPERQGFQRYASAFYAAWSGERTAADLLSVAAIDTTSPAFARASALRELGGYLTPANIERASSGLGDSDPMVRIGALDMLEIAPFDQRWSLAATALSDPVRGVRINAASLLADAPIERVPARDRERLVSASNEFIAAQRLNADRPESRATLGSFYARRGQTAEAEMEYLAALRLSPHYSPAAANLADLYRQLGREPDGESILRKALMTSPNDAGLRHALGLSLVRQKLLEQALDQLRQASELEPDSVRYSYVYAVALDSNGRRAEAIALLKNSLERHPDDLDTLVALVVFNREAGDTEAALEFALRLTEIAPHDPNVGALIEDLRSRSTQPGPR
jgi:Flp pilus assembly protein TadD